MTLYRSTPNMRVLDALPISFTPGTERPVHERAGGTGHRQTSVTALASEFQADAVVADRRVDADGVVVLTLREAGGHPLPAWKPGAHVDLLLGPDLTRQYSLCGDPADRLLADRRAAGAGRPRRLGARPRHRPRRATRSGRGPAQPLPAGRRRRATCSSPAASASPRSCRWCRGRGGGRGLAAGLRRAARASMAFLDELPATASGSIRPQDETGLLDLDILLGRPRRTPGLLLRPRAAAGRGRRALRAAGRPGRCTSSGSRRSRSTEPGAPSAFEVELRSSGSH